MSLSLASKRKSREKDRDSHRPLPRAPVRPRVNAPLRTSRTMAILRGGARGGFSRGNYSAVNRPFASRRVEQTNRPPVGRMIRGRPYQPSSYMRDDNVT